MPTVHFEFFTYSFQVILNTTAGEIEIELWCKETPMTCRNFIQLCAEGYYDNTIFHRVVRGEWNFLLTFNFSDFIIQGGDPTGTGEGGESIYGKPFKVVQSIFLTESNFSG